MKRLRKVFAAVFVAAWLFGGIAGLASALTVYNTDLDYHIFNGDSAYQVYTIADEPADFSDVTLFCGLDAMDTTNNVTPCYYNGQIVNATIINAENATLVTGKLLNAIHFGTGAYSVATISESNRIFSTVFAIRLAKINTAYNGMAYFEGTGFRLFISTWSVNGNIKIWIGNSTTSWNVQYVSGITVQAGKWYAIALNIDFNAGNAEIFVYDGDTMSTDTFSFDATIFQSVSISKVQLGSTFGSTPGSTDSNSDIDEFRLYVGRTLSPDEIKLLYLAGRKKLSEPANLTITNVAYDGSRFDITVNATLPAGAQYLYIPQIATTGDTVVQNWSTGHRLIDVSGKTWTTFTIPATPGSALTGLNSLAIETDSGVYAYGSGSYTLTNPSTALYYENTVQPTNTISAGRVTSLSWSGAGTLTLLKPSTLTLTAGDGQVKFDKYTLEDTKLDVLSLTNPLKITATLLPVTEYKITKDLNPVVSKINSNEDGVLSFTIDSTGTWEIFKAALGASIAMDYIMKVLLTTIIVAIFAMLVVERTPTKLDDRITKAMITMIALVIVIALVRVIVLTK